MALPEMTQTTNWNASVVGSGNDDSRTVFSDLTDTDADGALMPMVGDTTTTFSRETIQKTLLEELNKLNSNALKEKCKECGLVGLSKLTKPDMVKLLEQQFENTVSQLNDMSKNDLKQIAKAYNVKRISGVNKPYLLHHILLHRASKLILMPVALNELCVSSTATASVADTDASNGSSAPAPAPAQVASVELPAPAQDASLEDLSRQMKRIECQILAAKAIEEENERKRKMEEEENERKRKMEEEEDRKQKTAKEEEENERKRKSDELNKEQSIKKKQSIPKNVRTIVWNHYIGDDIIKHKCLCCKKVSIFNTNFEVGHVISEKNGGTHQIDNLRPICFACNHSMGTQNMVDFVVKYGLYIG